MEENIKFKTLETITKVLNKYLNVYYSDCSTYNNFATGQVEVTLVYDEHKPPLEVGLDIKTLNNLKGSKLIAHLENTLIKPLRNDRKKLNRVTVRLSRREYKSLNFLCKKYNSTYTDTMRRLIKEKFESIKKGGK